MFPISVLIYCLLFTNLITVPAVAWHLVKHIENEKIFVRFPLITIRNKVAKVMFLHLSVCLSVHRGVCLSVCWDTTPPPSGGAGTPPGPDTPLSPQSRHLPGTRHPRPDTPPADGHGCGWYASYCNAFLYYRGTSINVTGVKHSFEHKALIEACAAEGQEDITAGKSGGNCD